MKELSIVEPHLERMPLVVRQRLSAPNKPITRVYFADQGIVSVVATGARGQTVEAGVIGWEGVTGLPVILDANIPNTMGVGSNQAPILVGRFSDFIL